MTLPFTKKRIYESGPGFVRAKECPDCGHTRCGEDCVCNCDAARAEHVLAALLVTHQKLVAAFEELAAKQDASAANARVLMDRAVDRFAASRWASEIQVHKEAANDIRRVLKAVQS